MPIRILPRSGLVAVMLSSLFAGVLEAQGADHPPMSAAGDMSVTERNAGLHMEMSPVRKGTAADSAKAAAIASTLREALLPYKDTAAAVAAGYKMFLPGVKEQKVFHFTNNWHALQEAFRFDPTKPTSLLYRKGPDGGMVLVGAMYTAPKRFSVEKLDARVPTSIARWHKHVNWCLAPKDKPERWLERKDGAPVFGPESPIATAAACKAAGGRFEANVFGWMLHANVLSGTDAASIWGGEHAGHDMHAGMKMDGK